nr:hypothetical protein [Saccharothrix variisporea]
MAVNAVQRLPDRQPATHQVHVRPGQAERFAAPQADSERHRPQCVQAVVTCCAQQSTRLLGGERTHPVPVRDAELDQAGNVAGEEVFVHRVLKRGPHHPEQVPDRTCR